MTNEQYETQLNNLVTLANDKAATFKPYVGFHAVMALHFMEMHSYTAQFPQLARDGSEYDVRLLRGYFAHYRVLAANRGMSKYEFNALCAQLVESTAKQAFDWAKAAANVHEYAQHRCFPRHTACEARHTEALTAVLNGKAAA